MAAFNPKNVLDLLAQDLQAATLSPTTPVSSKDVEMKEKMMGKQVPLICRRLSLSISRCLPAPI